MPDSRLPLSSFESSSSRPPLEFFEKKKEIIGMPKVLQDIAQTEIPGTGFLRKPLEEEIARNNAFTFNPLVQETGGAFIRGATKADTLGLIDDQTGLTRAPQTPVGKGLETAGTIIEALNPHSPTNKVVGAGLGLVGKGAGKVLGPVGRAGGEMAKPIIEPIVETARKIFKNDIVAKLAPKAAVRREALERGVDLGDEFVSGGYNIDDFAGSLKLAKRKIEEASVKLRNLLGESSSKIDHAKLVDDIVEKRLKEATTDAEKEAARAWGTFQKSRAAENYGGALGETINESGIVPKTTFHAINPKAALKEKIFAGQNGYNTYGNALDSFIGRTYAEYERALHDAILDSLGPKRALGEAALREQEKAMLVKTVVEEAQAGVKPTSTARLIGKFFFPSSLAAATVGKATEAGVKAAAGGGAPKAAKSSMKFIGGVAKAGAKIAPRIPAILGNLSGN